MTRLAFLALALATGCLSVPDGPASECSSSSDCDRATGEVCEEGTCWGNPPSGVFAAVISPPSDRKDLVPKELTQVVITEAGWLNDLQLEVPVMVSGRIEAVCAPPLLCDRTSLGATITVTRSSQFHGGPGFKTVVSSESGAPGSSFEVSLPRTNENDAHYTLTVIPDGRGAEPFVGPPTPAQLVPPLRLDLAVGSTITAKTITLGALDLPSIDGTVVSSAGVGLAQYRVAALGHWELGAPMTEVSTVDYTGSDGKFRVLLSKDLVGPVELVARPYGDTLAPTLHLGGLASTGTLSRTLTQPQPQAVGAKANFSVKIMGVIDGGGGVVPVSGARVKVEGLLAPVQMGGATATFLAEATTDDTGIAKLDVLDGAIKDSYKLDVVPPASSSVGVMFAHPMTSLAPMSIILTSRIPIRGHVVDIHGDPLKDVSVTARPSLRFIWSLDDAAQSFLSAIPVATTVTSTGAFVLWVDPTVAGTWGHYDLVFEPAFKSRAPTWVEPDIEIPRTDVDSVLLPEVRLPDAAFVHGMVSDGYGAPILESEVKIFRLDTSLALCSEVSHAPASCPIPAVLQGRGASDDNGLVRLTLPR